MKPFSWDEKIARAQKLSAEGSATKEILGVYSTLTSFQKEVSRSLNGTEALDVRSVLQFLPRLKALVHILPSEPLQEAFADLSNNEERWSELLLQHWERSRDPETPSQAFLAYLLLQPYAQHVTRRMTMQAQGESAPRNCPACGNLPQLALLREYSNGAKRSLLCSLCSAEWEFRRVLCPSCGEQHKDKLPVFTAEEFEQARIEACDACHTYIKCIDLSKDGRAVPEVDDLATLALDLWAQEQGYARQCPNLFLLPAGVER